MIIRRSTWRLCLYALASLAAFLLVAIPAFNGELTLNFYSDSLVYEELSRRLPLGFHLIQIGANFFGPILILRALGGSHTLVYAFNVACLVAAYLIVVLTFEVDRLRFLFYLTITPLLFVSLLSVNKEIVALLSITAFAAYYRNGSRGLLALALVTSILVRWQLTLFMLVFQAVATPLNPFRRRRLLTLAAAAVVISIVYVRNLGLFQALDRVAMLGAQQYTEGSGLYARLIAVQNAYGYFLVFIPKALQQMVGLLTRYAKVTDFTDFFSNVIMFAHAAATLVLLVLVVYRRRMRLAIDQIYMAAVFCAVFALSPIFAPRYFFPVYVLLAITLAERRSGPDPVPEEARLSPTAPVTA